MPDVIVVGAGPAGSSAAHTLASAGLDVVVIDRAEFPRDKTCGDGLTPTSVVRLREMGVDLSDARSIIGYSYIHTRSDRQSDERFAKGGTQQGAAMPRRVLDARVLTAACAAGARILVGNVTGLVRDPCGRVCGVDLLSAGRKKRLYAAHTIVAAGAAGRSMVATTGDERIWSVAGRTYISMERGQRETLNELRVYFPLAYHGRTIPGYGWLFPVSDTQANIGVGVARTEEFRGVSIREMLIAFATEYAGLSKRQLAEVVYGTVSTAPVAIGESANAGPGLTVCGDAAGLGNPFTGEGIAGALVSGDAAARAIVHGVGIGANHDAIAREYESTLDRLLKRNIRLVRTIRATLDKPEFFHGRAVDLCFAEGRRANAWVRRIMHDETLGSGRDLEHVDSERVGRAIADLRSDLLATLGACEPFFPPLLEEYLADDDVDFGIYLSAALSTFGDLDDDRTLLLTRVASILEVMRLIDGLHSDLPEGTAAETRDAWGCNTTELVLADVLNAYVLRILARLPSAWSQAVSERLAEYLHASSRGARSRSSALLGSVLEPRGAGELLARLAAGRDPRESVAAADVERLASAFARMDRGSKRVSRAAS